MTTKVKRPTARKTATRKPTAATPKTKVRTVTVTTPSASYQVLIGDGLLGTLADRLHKLLGGKLPRLFVVTSPEIWALWSTRFLASFERRGVEPTILFLPSGEARKRMSSVEALADQLAAAGADRDSIILAFGGGVVGDLAGFLAAIYMRGIRYVQVPTTFLAQVDSSLGGKTGVNLARGKNLIGNFHHPLAVYADTAVLQTLPPSQLRAGLQESIKAGVIYDARLFAYMEEHAAAALAGDPAVLEHIVAASVRMKADVVSKDERESGLRMILNYGHTVGHTIEAATNYKQLLHGEAVAWGMIAALRIAQHRGIIKAQQAERIEKIVLSYGPLPSLKQSAAKLAALTAGDKKNRSGVRRFVLPTGIGKTEIVTDVSEAELITAIEEMLQLARKQAAR
ncbi:MAG: 3-dehydroquinate synthase [Acidobacteriaceae bacterium]